MKIHINLKLTRMAGSTPGNAVPAVPLEFHVSKSSRDKYDFEDTLFSIRGNVVFADFQAARVFANKMNAERDLVTYPESVIKAGQINAMGLIDEILHYVVQLYREQINVNAMSDALNWLSGRFDTTNIDKVLTRFIEQFPTNTLYRNKQSVKEYLLGETDGIPNRLIVLEEMVLLWLANQNPAFGRYIELFDDSVLLDETIYGELMGSVELFFDSQPAFGPENLPLIKLLRRPAEISPDSLEGQLEYMQKWWGLLIEPFMLRLLSSIDFVKEENKAVFWGPVTTFVPEYHYEPDHEYEKFSADLHWMPNLVLLAKSTMVWLDQLSRKYHRAISRLDQIPDEELDTISRWGFTGLWLIGIWKRSNASRKIKQWCGNPEAISSAYSLFDYDIADEIGGYDALYNLKERCWQRGIRLACDMVPNHTGIDSRWMREHPDWFLSVPYSPYPSHTFNGGNLSEDPRYGVFIEDHYYTRQDASVVFKREDYWTGDVRFIYHGNDGTNMPWNDTAQLNYLLPEVREAVIQKILHVARLFSVIRFDAAMTLSKRHYQRLWFPEPGSGGDIPTRAEQGMSKAAFSEHIPEEFWREVVDRVAAEVPDTLLLAEAFWLMEGYFVRTLGMHRVYNSAFMNMLKKEENEKYRQTVINTIQFDPEILKRYVNFMNNPDEETAIAQFGDGDKYFGVCVMLVTMPGLPMFGHGQIEGFHEKYGMEYSKAYWNEEANWGLVQRHEREIFPLMKKRYLFAEVANFHFYNFNLESGHVNNNVFVYSNQAGNERALVVFNNKYEQTAGWIDYSVERAFKQDNDVSSGYTRLGEVLTGSGDAKHFCIFKDSVSGLEYIRSSKDLRERGMFIQLDGFKHCVFMDFVDVMDDDTGDFASLNHHLDGRGVASISEALKELALAPLLSHYDNLLSNVALESFFEHSRLFAEGKPDPQYTIDLSSSFRAAITAGAEFTEAKVDFDAVTELFERQLSVTFRLLNLETQDAVPSAKKAAPAYRYLAAACGDSEIVRVLYFWLILNQIGKLTGRADVNEQTIRLAEDWLLFKRVTKTLSAKELQQLKIFIRLGDWSEMLKMPEPRAYRILLSLLADSDVQGYIGINRFENVLWFNKELYERFIGSVFTIAVLSLHTTGKRTKSLMTTKVLELYSLCETWLLAEKKSDFMVENLLKYLQNKKPRTGKTRRTKTAPARKKQV